MIWYKNKIYTTSFMISVFMGGMIFMMSCSSAPEPQPTPSKQEIRHDSDRFFQKMGQEEDKISPSPDKTSPSP